MSNNICSLEFQRWIQQTAHLKNLLHEKPLKKDKIVRLLDKMIQGAQGYLKVDRIRELEEVEGVPRNFEWCETRGGWKVVDEGVERVDVYAWESRSEDVGVGGLSGGGRAGEKSVGARGVMGERSDSETSAVALVEDEEKGDNLGEKKSPMTEDVRETRSSDSQAGTTRENSLMARAIQGEKLSKDEKNELKALNKDADLELKRIVPVVCKYPKLLAILTSLGFLIGSAVFLAAGIMMITVGKHWKDDAPVEVKKYLKHLSNISQILILGGFAIYFLSMLVFHKVLMPRLARKIEKMYGERCNLSSVELAALGCEDLEDRAERMAGDNEELEGSMKAAAWRRATATLVPFAKLELAYMLFIPFVSLIMCFTA